jgi:hypothetical protein
MPSRLIAIVQAFLEVILWATSWVFVKPGLQPILAHSICSLKVVPCVYRPGNIVLELIKV